MVDVGEGYSTGSIGTRLRTAREAKRLTLDDVASRTRIPTRHLQAIELGDWDALPAPTYSVGFARSYANAVGLNGAEIGQAVRSELGAGSTSRAVAAQYEPADPARVPPRSLALIAAALAVLLIAGYAIWRNSAVGVDDLDPTGAPPAAAPVASPAAPPAASAPVPPPASGGPVVLTALNDVWLRVYEANGGPRLFENTLKAGERFELPATAQNPQILTGRPDALRVTVGTTEIPQLGQAEKTIADVSLKPADLLARLSPAAAGAAPAQPED